MWSAPAQDRDGKHILFVFFIFTKSQRFVDIVSAHK